jgi:Fic family protein
MDRSHFTSDAAGKIQRTLRGYDAFVPNPLPRSVVLSPSLIRATNDASLIVGRLDGFGYQIPNPDVLIIPYTRLEALASSRIEGTQASLSELFYFEAADENQTDKIDIVEVKNYLKALNNGLELLSELPLSLRLIRRVHRELMTGARGGTPDKTPGEFRTSQNWIGSAGQNLQNAQYVPPPPEHLMACLSDWELFLHEDLPTIPILIQCAMMHYQFEAIHPFLHGNGRVGRLLITFFLCARGVLKLPLLYLSSYFEENRSEYYDCLMAVSQQGDWERWFEFFLTGVIEQGNHAIQSARKILDYREQLRQLAFNQTEAKLIDLIFKHPYLTAKKAESELGVTFTTAQKTINLLVDKGVLLEISGQRRNRKYAARHLLEILKPEEPLYTPKSSG